MIAHLNRRYHFSAAHRLHADSLTPNENRAAYGKCNNPHGHGHNYVVTVTLSGRVNPMTGMVANLADLDDFAHKSLLNLYDHANLNTLPEFSNLVPTTENLTIAPAPHLCGFPPGCAGTHPRRRDQQQLFRLRWDGIADGQPCRRLCT